MKIMSGIYIHIPFCKSKCGYCAFFSKANPNKDVLERYVDVLCEEIKSSFHQKQEVQHIVQDLQNKLHMQGEKNTIYFGGGTPSILTINQLLKIFNALPLSSISLEEITLEANPEHLTEKYLSDLKTLVGRLKML
jgi:oxygen-independent coproporphyrinogen-3 oxidase